jgi:hypothetical protein
MASEDFDRGDGHAHQRSQSFGFIVLMSMLLVVGLVAAKAVSAVVSLFRRGGSDE